MNKKVRIKDKMYDTVGLEEYVKNKEVFLQHSTAIHIPEISMVLPIINKHDKIPGIIVGSGVSYVNEPDEDEKEYYSDKDVIDFDNLEDIQDMISKQKAVKALEREVLTSPDNLFLPKIFDDDAPEMKALKEAVLAKQVDLDKYESRFGNNYANDKRLFNKNTISLPMTKRLCDALDIEATLELKDKSPDVPNPMNTTIRVKLTGGLSDE